MKRLWMLLLAFLRLDQLAVCEMSVGRPPFADFHDYDDDEFGLPVHFALLRCKFCGKRFTI